MALAPTTPSGAGKGWKTEALAEGDHARIGARMQSQIVKDELKRDALLRV